MASKRRIRRRSCGKKIRHKTPQGAWSRARSLQQSQGEMHAYKCRFCGGYHIGH